MPTLFNRTGKTFRPVPSNDLHKALTPTTFTVKQDIFGLFYEDMEAFELPSKRYADNDKTATRILDTFQKRGLGTGVLLSGEKGSGKSLLAKTVSVQGAARGLPTILINAAWHGSAFNQLIQDTEQAAIVIFDEFEKVYNREEQEDILTLFDGTVPSNKLYIITCNDKFRVDGHMRNRPGRMFYSLDFRGLTSQFINEYCVDQLKNKKHLEEVLKIAAMFKDFNFDMLKALVEECNRYGESPLTAVRMLNICPEYDGAAGFKAVIKHETRVVDLEDAEERNWNGNPLATDLSFGVYVGNEGVTRAQLNKRSSSGKDLTKYQYIRFQPSDIAGMDVDKGEFSFKNDEGFSLQLTRIKVVSNHAFDLLR